VLPEPIEAAAIRTGQLAQVLPDLTTTHRIYLLNHCPRGMLPSVRSLIDYLLAHMPASIQERSVDAVQKPWAQHPPG
jgi:DNA-binding transcriptional LysR family regulator